MVHNRSPQTKGDAGNSLTDLMKEFDRLESRLDALTGHQVDALIHPDGGQLLLRNQQKVLIEQNNRYRRLLGRMATLVFELNPAGEVLYINQQAFPMLGFREADLHGKDFLSLVQWPLDDQIGRHEFLKRLGQGDLTDCRMPITRRDGSTIILRLNTSNEYDASGHLHRIVGMAIDVTVQELAEKELAQRQELLHQTFEHVPALISITDWQGRFMMVNPQWSTIFGYDLDELKTLSFSALFAETEDIQKACTHTRKPLPGWHEFTIVTRDGEPRLTTWTHADLSYGYRLWFGRDITEERQREQDARQAYERLERILNTMPLQIALLNHTGEIVLVNRAWRSFGNDNGLPMADSCLGGNYIEICDQAKGEYSDGARQVSAAIREILADQRESFLLEYPCPSPRQQRWFELICCRYQDERNTTGAVMIHRDITERVLAEVNLSRRMEQQVMLNRLSQSVIEYTNAEAVFSEITQSTSQVLKNDFVALVLQTSRNRFQLAAHAGGSPAAFAAELTRQLHIAIAPDLFNSREYFTRTLVGSHAIGELLPDVRPADAASCVWVPIATQGELNGFLIALSEDEARYDMQDAEFLQSVGNLVGLALGRERTEHALKQSEQKYRNIVETAKEGIWIIDPQGRTVFANPQLCRMLGLSPGEMKNTTLSDFLDPDCVEFFTRNTIQQRSDSEQQDYRFRRKDGTFFWALISTSPLANDDRSLSGTLMMITDITDRKLAEIMNSRLVSIIESSDDAIIGMTLDGRIETWNPGAERVLGYHERDIVGQPGEILVVPDRQSEFRDIIARVRAGEVIAHLESDFRSNRGENLFVSLSLSPVRDIHGEVIGLAAIARDFTKERKLQHQLRQSQKMESIGKLAGGVAHDFNNLLTVIDGYSELMTHKLEVGNPLELDLEQIRKASQRAQTLTRQLLAFSRKQMLLPKVINLNEVVGDIEKMLHRLIGEDVNLHIVTAPDLGLVYADRGQIEQVVMNLVVNARDAMPLGGELTIETANVEIGDVPFDPDVELAGTRCVMIMVRDTGCGIEPDVVSRIFEPFYTTKCAEKGTGLGLSTVYGIVRQSGGAIDVKSTPGKGSAFFVYLPVHDGETEKVDEPRSKPLEHIGSETILLVEDEESVRQLAALILRRHGYTVIEAGQAGDALLICEQKTEPFDLLLTDVVMPKMNGRQLYERLETLMPGMKVLFMSGYTDDSIFQRGILEQGRPFIHKPFSSADLVRHVRQVLDSAASR